MLCNSCVQIMIQFYKFRLMCKTNNRRFRATKATLEQNQSKGAKTATNCFTHDALEKVDEEKCDRNNFVVQGNSTKACQSIEENRTNSDIQIIDDIPPVKKQSASNNKQLSICTIIRNHLGIYFLVFFRNQNLCPICGKWYKKSTHLDTHSNAKPYGCHQCDKSFKTGSDLRVHLRTHTGERRKICNVCYKAFVTTSALYKHIRMHTGNIWFFFPQYLNQIGICFCSGFKLNRLLKVE